MNVRTHVPLPVKRRVGWALTRRPIASVIRRATAGRVRRWGVDLELPRPQVSDSVLASIFVRGHESAEIRSVLRLGGVYTTILDLGASAGVLGAVAASRCSTAGEYIGLDGNAELTEIARANVRRNFGGVIALIHGALAYGTTTTFFSTNENILRSSVDVTGEAVPAFTLGQLLGRSNRVGNVLLLCDIEGGEWDILDNDLSSLRRIHTMVIEIHEQAGRSVETFIERLADSGIKTIHRDGAVITATKFPIA